METKKLYYEDSHLKTFSARVESCMETEKGWQIILDATAFYPEGGGQACDLGILGERNVLDVQEAEGAVVHLCDGPLPVGETVEGAIDWERRFDLMQQHSGEHMLSGVIHRLYGFQNMGFHIGNGLVTVDVAGPVPTEDLQKIEDMTNAAIWANRPVKAWYPEAEELHTIPYRFKKALEGPVRIVEFPGTDICACCGTHVKATGEVGLVKIVSCVKFRQGVRLEMVSGARAFLHLRLAYEQNRQVSQAFSAKIMETGEAARKMNEALNGEKFKVTGLRWQLFDRVAEDFRRKGNVLYFADGLTPADIRELADRIAKTCGGIAAVFSGEGTAYQMCMVCQAGDVKTLGSAMNQALRGRGGGKPGFFQGSVAASREEIQAFFRDCGQVFVKSAQSSL